MSADVEALQLVVPAAAVLAGVALTQWSQRRTSRQESLWERRSDLYVRLLSVAYSIEYFYEFVAESLESRGEADTQEEFTLIWTAVLELKHPCEAFASDKVFAAYDGLDFMLRFSNRALAGGSEVDLEQVEDPIRALRAAIHQDLDPTRKTLSYGIRTGTRPAAHVSPLLHPWAARRQRKRLQELHKRLEASAISKSNEGDDQ